MKLKVLDLQNNLLKHIDGSTFSLLQNISIVKLGDNGLSNIPVDTFKHLENLTRLNLKNNHFHTLKAGIFSELKKLQVLVLSGNNLKNLPDKTFQNNHQLEILLLDNNNLNNLGRNLFSHLNLLKIIRLEMNNLTYIHPNTFTGLENIINIIFYGNQIKCTCSFLHMNANQISYAELIADCFLQKQTSKIISRTEKILSSMWSNWMETGCSTSTLRVRLCQDCSKKRFCTRCSHHIQSENSTCVMVEGRGAYYKPRFASKHQLLMDCEVECLSSTVNIITISLIVVGGCVEPVVTGLFCTYFRIKYIRRLNTDETNHQNDDPTQQNDDPNQDNENTNQNIDDTNQDNDDTN